MLRPAVSSCCIRSLRRWCLAAASEFTTTAHPGDPVADAQQELDDFFGAQFAQPEAFNGLAGSVSPGQQAAPSQRRTSVPQQARTPLVRDAKEGDAAAPLAAHASRSDTPTSQSHSPDSADTLTHIDTSGRASMVDVGQKPNTERVARASARVHIGAKAFSLVQADAIGKGDVLTTAQIAGICAAKHTATLIPLCHGLLLSRADVRLRLDGATHSVVVHAEARAVGQTGVEMEALTAAGVAALTVYDMCKAVTKDIVIGDLRLDYKSGGKSGVFERAA